MTIRSAAVPGLPHVLLSASSLIVLSASWVMPAKAQDVSMRLQRRRVEAVIRQIAADLPSASTGGTQSGTPANTSNATQGASRNSSRARRQITASLDGRLGFDKQTVVLGNPAVVGIARRRIRSVELSLEYPWSDTTSLYVSVPYIDQKETVNSALGTLALRGNGLGDVGVYLQRSFPEIARGTELSASVGLILPTGKDGFNLGPNELPTGVGFYQPVARLTLRKLHVPLQFYGAVDYGTSFSRNVGGTRVNLPDSYGGELGFYYVMGPEFTSQTSVSVSKVSSPFIDAPGSTVGYLSQSLTYQANLRTSLRASIDVGLTEDSTDAFAGLSLNSSF